MIAFVDQEVRQRDDGLWSTGLSDEAPCPFQTREFALAVRGYLSPISAPRLRHQKSGVHIASPRS
jgi:hypothetical protein